MDSALGRLSLFVAQVMKVSKESGEPMQLADFLPWARKPEQPASIDDAFALLRAAAASNKRN